MHSWPSPLAQEEPDAPSPLEGAEDDHDSEAEGRVVEMEIWSRSPTIGVAIVIGEEAMASSTVLMMERVVASSRLLGASSTIGETGITFIVGEVSWTPMMCELADLEATNLFWFLAFF
ncbi:hypothetical protein ACFE04_017388 [Oxalis oulophora]